MKIIFIHGINQQNLDAMSFEKHWLDVFNIGLNKNNLNLDAEDFRFSFPFYGDILTSYNFKNTLNLETIKINDEFFNKLPPFFERYRKVPSSSNVIPLLPHYEYDLHSSLKNKFLSLSQLAKDRALREMVILLNNFPDLHESLVEKFVSEAYLYWYQPSFKEAIHDRITACFDPNEKHIVIAHSLGTVIAYNVLQELAPHYHVERFITLASPLPFNVVQRHIPSPMSRPQVLQGDWYNFYSRDDYLTTFPMVEPLFDFEPKIQNKLITTFVDRPHEIIGYLQHPSVIRCIFEKICNFNSNLVE